MAETASSPEGDPAQQEQAFANFQFEIYAYGLGGQTPKLPLTAGELEARARERLSAEAFGYVAGGAGSELTMRANLRAFERWEIVPRMLRDVSERDLSTTVLGTSMPAPVLLPGRLCPRLMSAPVLCSGSAWPRALPHCGWLSPIT